MKKPLIRPFRRTGQASTAIETSKVVPVSLVFLALILVLARISTDPISGKDGLLLAADVTMRHAGE